jgi:hypothetical protein
MMCARESIDGADHRRLLVQRVPIAIIKMEVACWAANLEMVDDTSFS